MSATTIIDSAPLGALIRYTDGSPKPPARFTKRLAAWERSNGVGRLVKKEPPPGLSDLDSASLLHPA